MFKDEMKGISFLFAVILVVSLLGVGSHFFFDNSPTGRMIEDITEGFADKALYLPAGTIHKALDNFDDQPKSSDDSNVCPQSQ